MPRKQLPKKSPQHVKAGRLGGLAASARVDVKARAQKAQSGLLRRFELEADPDSILEPAERTRRAVALRRIHLLKIREKGS